jgi:hypothetical protein
VSVSHSVVVLNWPPSTPVRYAGDAVAFALRKYSHPTKPMTQPVPSRRMRWFWYVVKMVVWRSKHGVGGGGGDEGGVGGGGDDGGGIGGVGGGGLMGGSGGGGRNGGGGDIGGGPMSWPPPQMQQRSRANASGHLYVAHSCVLSAVNQVQSATSP